MKFKKLSDETVEANYQHKFIVDRYLRYIKDKKVLDAGCWTGPVEKEIVERGIEAEIIGIDENEMALEVAKVNFPNFIFFRCRLPEPNDWFINNYKGYFDTVIFLDVLEHLPKGSEVNVMSFLNKILNSNGMIIISTMADHIFNFIDPAWFFGHRHYKLRSISRILRDSGFQTIEVLKIGNLFWDIDLLSAYIYKHILKRKYRTSISMHRRIIKGLGAARIATRIYLLAKKVNSSA